MPRLTTPNQDYVTFGLAQYLQTNINASYPSKVVIRSIRGYDAVNVPISDFPLLKVFRLYDNYKRNTEFSLSTGIITYSLSFPDVEQLPGILKWMADSINHYLLQYELDTFRTMLPTTNQFGYRAEYRLTKDEITNSVYPYLRFNISLRDDLNDPTLLQTYTPVNF